MEVRIDKWLWAVRVYKTRNMAAEACKTGKVKLDGKNIKPSHNVKIGEEYEVKIDVLEKKLKVLALLENRVSAKLVPDYMQDLTPVEEIERLRLIKKQSFERRERGIGRPTKKDRREIEEFKYL